MRSTIGHVLAALCILPTGASFAADSAYAVSKTDVSAAAGHKATASVTITAKNGWHLNQEAPFTLKLTPAPGVVVDKPKLGRGDLALSTQTQARFDVGVTLSDPGKKVIEAEASFVLCQEDSCRPIKEKLTISAEATAAPAAPAKKTGKKRARRS
jgi:hypothetical protein